MQGRTGADGAPTHTDRMSRRKHAPGDLRWDGKAWRRWNGARWVRAAYSLHPERLTRPQCFDREARLDTASRNRALALAVENQVTTNSATLVHQGPSGVVLGYRRRVSHLFHALLTLLSAGLWALVWLAMAAGRREDRVLLEVDDWGNVWAQSVHSA